MTEKEIYTGKALKRQDLGLKPLCEAIEHPEFEKYRQGLIDVACLPEADATKIAMDSYTGYAKCPPRMQEIILSGIIEANAGFYPGENGSQPGEKKPTETWKNQAPEQFSQGDTSVIQTELPIEPLGVADVRMLELNLLIAQTAIKYGNGNGKPKK